MPSFNHPCDINQGFNFDKDNVSPVGFIKKLKIGTVELAVDLTAKDPENYSTDLKVVSVMSDMSWSVSPTDALYLGGQVSVSNQQKLKLMMYQDLTNVEVLVQIACYWYDLVAKKYYKSFTADAADMKGLVEKVGGELALSVSDFPSTEVESPENFSFHIGVKPQPTSQTVTIATSTTDKIVKQWGFTKG